MLRYYPFFGRTHGLEETKIASMEGQTLCVRATDDITHSKWSNKATIEDGQLVQCYISHRSGVGCRRVFRPVDDEEWNALMRQNDTQHV